MDWQVKAYWHDGNMNGSFYETESEALAAYESIPIGDDFFRKELYEKSFKYMNNVWGLRRLEQVRRRISGKKEG